MSTFENISTQAARLFAERGVEAVSMRDVADACGITVAALYYHFTSKDDLYEEVARSQFELFLGRLEAGRAGWSRDEETPSRVAALVFDVVLADPTLFLLTQRDLHRADQGERQAKARAQFGRARTFLRQSLERYQGSKDVSEHDTLALASIVTGYCEYVHADARSRGPERDAFLSEQREGLVGIVRRAFEGR